MHKRCAKLQQRSKSIQDQAEKEMQKYQDMPPIITFDDPDASQKMVFSYSYLCVQTSSTCSEQVLSAVVAVIPFRFKF